MMWPCYGMVTGGATLGHSGARAIPLLFFKEVLSGSDSNLISVAVRKQVLTIFKGFNLFTRNFSAMKIIKIRLRNKMEDDFLSDSSITIYIEREIAMKFSSESIIVDFQDLKERRVPL